MFDPTLFQVQYIIYPNLWMNLLQPHQPPSPKPQKSEVPAAMAKTDAITFLNSQKNNASHSEAIIYRGSYQPSSRSATITSPSHDPHRDRWPSVHRTFPTWMVASSFEDLFTFYHQ